MSVASRTFFVHTQGMSESKRVQYKFMIPEDLKKALEEAAEYNRRSLSAEIVERLQQSVYADSGNDDVVVTMDAFKRHLAEVKIKMDRIEKNARILGIELGED
jgi:Icc-related predicted phosphoesterase